MHRCRTTLTRLAVATATAAVAAGCSSGSEAVSVPGADAIVTAPVATIDVAAVTDSTTGGTTAPATDTTTGAETEEPTPAVEDAPATTAPEPVPIETPAPSTTATQPSDTTAAPPATEAPSDEGFFRIGDEGPEVGLMQLKLSVLDYLPAGSDTGVFDQATENGLRRFQADYGLGVDGVFGPLTGRSLNAAVQSVNVET